jgi:HD-GYP domain-containing protein (c-di-GMP phosphodiesterase class II)
MASRRISISDIVVGKPLQWPVYDSDGGLLLKKGFIVVNADQIAELIARGMYAETENSAAAREREAHTKQVDNPSVVRMLNNIRSELRILLYNLASEADARGRLLAIAGRVVAAIDANPDVALGCISLNQEGTYGARHSVDTAVVAAIIARTLKKPADEIVTLCAAALTMNLSMIRPQDKLQDKNTPLSTAERELIDQHPVNSVNQLRSAGITDEDWLSWIIHHHENENGSGYPAKKTAVDIPQNAKIIAVADRYCASICERSYRKTLLPNAALRDILLSSNKTVAAGLAAVLIREFGGFPIGSIVRLEDGEIGVVTSKGETNLTPCVHALVSPRGAALTVAIKRDTHKPAHAIKEVLRLDQIGLKISMRQLWGEIASF